MRRPGTRPARVVAVHREASIVRDGDGDRTATVSGAFRFEALAASDYPTVGDWVALDSNGVIAAVLPRRTAFKRMAADASRLLSGLDDEQVMASNVDVALLVAGLDNDFNLRRIERYLAVAWSSEVLPVVVLNKADLADDVDGRVVAVEAIAPGRRDRAGLGLDRPRTRRPASPSAARRRRRRSSGRPASASRRSSTRCSARTARRRPPSADPIARPPHDDAPGAVRAARRRAARGHARDPGAGGPRGRGRPRGGRSTRSPRSRPRCRFSDCAHESEPGCAVRLAIADGRLDEDRLASFRKLQREQARVARQEDPRARAESRRTWKLIHKSVNEHMKRKYGDDR